MPDFSQGYWHSELSPDCFVVSTFPISYSLSPSLQSSTKRHFITHLSWWSETTLNRADFIGLVDFFFLSTFLPDRSDKILGQAASKALGFVWTCQECFRRAKYLEQFGRAAVRGLAHFFFLLLIQPHAFSPNGERSPMMRFAKTAKAFRREF